MVKETAISKTSDYSQPAGVSDSVIYDKFSKLSWLLSQELNFKIIYMNIR